MVNTRRKREINAAVEAKFKNLMKCSFIKSSRI